MRRYPTFPRKSGSTKRESSTSGETYLEKHLERDVLDALRKIGFTVMKTGKDRSSLTYQITQAVMPYIKPGVFQETIFKIVGNILRRFSSNDAGTPDLLVWHPCYGKVMVGIELKGKTTKVSTEQDSLACQGVYYIARSLDEVCNILLERPLTQTLEANIKTVRDSGGKGAYVPPGDSL